MSRTSNWVTRGFELIFLTSIDSLFVFIKVVDCFPLVYMKRHTHFPNLWFAYIIMHCLILHRQKMQTKVVRKTQRNISYSCLFNQLSKWNQYSIWFVNLISVLLISVPFTFKSLHSRSFLKCDVESLTKENCTSDGNGR